MLLRFCRVFFQEFVSQFLEHVYGLRDLVFDGSWKGVPLQVSQVVRQRHPVSREVCHQEARRRRRRDASRVRTGAPKDELGMILDEVDLNGRVVEFHNHSRVVADPPDHLGHHGPVLGRHHHLVDRQR